MRYRDALRAPRRRNTNETMDQYQEVGYIEGPLSCSSPMVVGDRPGNTAATLLVGRGVEMIWTGYNIIIVAMRRPTRT